MNDAEAFIAISDFATLKNDAGPIQGTVTIPSGLVLTAGQLYTQSSTITIGTKNAPSRVEIASTKESSVFYAGSVMVVYRNGQIAGPISVPYNIVAYSRRTDPNTITITAAITNPYGENLTTASGAETFTFEISSFLSPFENV